VNSAHNHQSSSYPVAYSLIILPLTIARCVEFGHHNVPSAVTFFGVSIFYLSGAINVVLFLIIRPGLLLFPRPEERDEPEIELAQPEAPQDTVSAIFSDTTRIHHSPDPSSSATLGDECSKERVSPSHVKSRLSKPISDDIEI
jgi:hypothetical protein